MVPWGFQFAQLNKYAFALDFSSDGILPTRRRPGMPACIWDTGSPAPPEGRSLAHNLRRNAIGRGTLTGRRFMTYPRRFGLPAAMSESPTPGRIDGRLGLAIGIVGSAALVIGVWLYALYGGSTTSAPRPSAGTRSERSEVAPTPSKNQIK